ncbi:hypothetical protein [Cyclobacterium xiamenense]|uniref:hypothetical protein n=1 Tax=Cyclobacterium xiamenense TaxID=1297121 RepID=UPI0035CEE145
MLRIWLFIIFSIYQLVLLVVLEKYVLKYFGYLTRLNLDILELSVLQIFLVSFILLVSFFKNTSFTQISAFLVISFFITLPMSLVVFSLKDLDIVFFLLIIIAGNLIVTYPLRKIYLTINIKEDVFIWFSIVCVIFSSIYYFRGFNNVFVSEIYTERAISKVIARDMLLGNYLIVFSSYFFVPYLAIHAILRKQYSLLVPLSLAQLIFFNFGGNKSYVVALIVTLLITLNFERLFLARDSFIYRFCLLVTGSLVVVALIPSTSTYSVPLALLAFRLFWISGHMFHDYSNFFIISDNLPTFLSHVNFISFFIDYPYDDTLGYTVSGAMNDDFITNANASFVITDGVAAFGSIFGVLVAFILLRFFLTLIHNNFYFNNRFTLILVFPFFMNLLNTSVFTSFLTGCGFLIFLQSLFRKK